MPTKNLTHIAATLLCGWYLMAPPYEGWRYQIESGLAKPGTFHSSRDLSNGTI